MAPKFLSLAEVLEIHQDQIVRYSGASGIRDIELLKSALGIPPVTFGGEFMHTDLYEMAAACLFHLVKNHPFVDGNKRVGVVSGLVFLTLNGFDFTAPEDELSEMVLTVARGEMDKTQVAVFIRNWSNPILVSKSPHVSFPNNRKD